MSSMSPAGVGTSPSIIQQALPSPITPMTPTASWASSGDDDPLELYVDALTPGVRTSRRSSAVNNNPPAGVGTPLRTSSPVPKDGNAVGVSATAYGTRAIPGRASKPRGKGYLTAAQRRKRPAVAHKRPRSVPRQDTPSSPSDAGSRRSSSASGGSGGGSRSGGSGGRGGGGGGDSNGDDDDDDSLPSDHSGPSRRRGRRRADRVLGDAEMQRQLAQILQDQGQTAAGTRIAGITTTNTITRTYKNGQRPTVTRNSTSMRN